MKYKTILSKRDLFIAIGCVVFVLLNIAAIGNSGRQKAKEIICLSNMKQWHEIFAAYANDNSGFFVPDYYENGSRCSWWEATESYYKDRNMLLCPSAIKLRRVSSSGAPYTDHEGGVEPFCSYNVGSGYKTSYSCNGWMSSVLNVARASSLGRFAEWRWENMNTLVQPDTIPLMADATGWPRKFPHAYTEPPLYRYEPVTSHTDRLKEFCIDRHGPANDPYINMALADGSARNVGLKELWALNWHKQWQEQRHDYQPVVSWPEWMQDFTDYE